MWVAVPGYLRCHHCLPGCVLEESWSQEIELGITSKYSKVKCGHPDQHPTCYIWRPDTGDLNLLGSIFVILKISLGSVLGHEHSRTHPLSHSLCAPPNCKWGHGLFLAFYELWGQSACCSWRSCPGSGQSPHVPTRSGPRVRRNPAQLSPLGSALAALAALASQCPVSTPGLDSWAVLVPRYRHWVLKLASSELGQSQG